MSAPTRIVRTASLYDSVRGESQRFATWLVDTRLWVSLCITALAAFTSHALGSSPSFQLLTCVATAALLVYGLDTVLEESDSLSRRTRGATLLTQAAGIGFFISATLLPLRAALLACGGLCLSLLYIARHPSSGRQLKHLFGLKAPFIGGAVGIAVSSLPWLAQGPARELAKPLALAVPLALACTANAILCDIPDTLADCRRSVPTLPCARGRRSALRVCRGLLLGSLAGAVLLPTLAVLSRCGIVVLDAALLGLTFAKPLSSRLTVELVADGALLLPLLVQGVAAGMLGFT